jgi:hypothetical protein
MRQCWSHHGERRLIYKMIAERGDETVKSERTSSLITIAKARVWASEGWHVTITDGEGTVFAPSEFEDLLAAQSARASAAAPAESA